MSELENAPLEGEVVPETIEDKARGMGWKPAEEFDGDKSVWVYAKEFVGRKPLFDKIHDQNRKLSEVEKTLKATAEHVKKVGEIAYKKAVADLQKERKLAVAQADVLAVHEIDDELEELKQTAAASNEPPPEFTAWTEENEWFGKDPELFDFACATYDAHMKRNPGETDLKKVLDKVKEVTKRAYPEKFGNVKPVHNSVEGGARPSSVKSGPSYSSLSSEQKRVCDTFVRSGVMTKEAYVKSLVEIGELA